MVFSPKVIKGAFNVLGGPAVKSQYLCIITPPKGMRYSAGTGILGPILAVGGMANLAIMATEASLPGRALATQDVSMFGTTRKMPYGYLYDSFKMKFICTNAMTERTFFDAWQQFIISPSSQYMEYHEQYKTDIIVKKLKGSGAVDSLLAGESPTMDPPIAEAGSLLSTYVIEEAYPARIGYQELSYGSHEVLTLDVEFYFTRYKSAIDYIFSGGLPVP